MKAPSWALRRSPHSVRTAGGQLVRGDDAGQHGVLPVVADVRDPVGPADHLALGRRRRRARPAVVGDPVDGLGAQVERGEGDERAPGRVVEARRARRGRARPRWRGRRARARSRGRARWPRSAATFRPAGPRDGGGDLRHLERVGEAGALVVLGEHEDLGLAGQAPEGGGVQDAVAVALEAGAPAVGLLGLGAGRRRPTARVAPGASSASSSSSRSLRARAAPAGGAPRPRGRRPGRGPDPGVRVGVGQADRPGVAGHRRCPAGTALRLAGRGQCRSCPAVCPVAVTSRWPRDHPSGPREETDQVDVRIGITHTPKELEVEMPDDADRDKVVAEIEKLLKTGRRRALADRPQGPPGRRPGGQGRLRRGRGAVVGAPRRVRRPLRTSDGGGTGSRAVSAAPDLLDLRLVFVTGKGGVGKTTVAAGPGPAGGRARQARPGLRGRRQGRRDGALRGAADRLHAAGDRARRLVHVDGHRGVAARVPQAPPAHPGGRPDRPAGQGVRLRGDRGAGRARDPHRRQALLGGARVATTTSSWSTPRPAATSSASWRRRRPSTTWSRSG